MFRSIGFRGVCALGIALCLCQCDKVSVPGPASKAVASPYDITLKLTPDAVARLSGLKDHVMVTGFYYGMPTDAALPKANKTHQLELGEDRYTFDPQATRIRIPGQNIDHSRFGDIVDKQVYVFISAWSVGPAGNSDELLECTHFRGTIERVQTTPIEISCTLLPPLEGEDRVIP